MSDLQYNSMNHHSWAERNGFAPWAVAMLWLVVVFLLFQGVSALLLVLLILLSEQPSDLLAIADLLMEKTDLLFVVNSIGQILFIGLATFLVVRLHASSGSRSRYLRVIPGPHTAGYVVGGLLLILAVQPVVIWLGYFNSLLPIPDSITALQESQYDMIREFLTQDGVLLFALFSVALVPGVCEELLFRGYVMRAFEKSWGIIVAIVVSGFVFALFHLQIANLLPLATLGMVLGIMTWLSGSIWPAVAAHILNNAMAVVGATYYPDLIFREMTPDILPPLWLVIPATVLAVWIIHLMIRWSDQIKPMDDAERI